MSLKNFHIAFVIVSFLFSALFAAWCLLMPGLPAMFQIMGWMSAAGAVFLLVYGFRFFRKIRGVIT